MAKDTTSIDQSTEDDARGGDASPATLDFEWKSKSRGARRLVPAARLRRQRLARFPGALTPDPVLAADVVDELNRRHAAGSIDEAIATTAFLADRLFGGDTEALASMGRRHATLLEVAGSDDLTLGSTELWRCVGILRLTAEVPLDLLRAIGKGKASELITLCGTGQALRLAARCQGEGWSVKRTIEETRAIKALEGIASPGPRPHARWFLDVRQACALVRRALETRLQAKDVETLTGDEVAAFATWVKELRDKLPQLESKIERLWATRDAP